ncbi:FecR family protein [Chitinophaga niabensis]|uniref:Ferric-dicitrate binding protein FerR, regulates iron transport through sigma-19 n=1 Tax=Chitinophaga niabensis TaxID=536979 RepID=A0A1N6DJ45_9BACT|nr:FecR family protein [Chitinophaga niabensis]SIN70778.1 ferric-dicitrate binding protein FerR, regulates iron transport through sigma-19 [Chitinophaga niabensis]
MRERIIYLIEQYYHNRSTREELDELMNIIQAGEHDGEIDELMRNFYEEIKEGLSSGERNLQQGVSEEMKSTQGSYTEMDEYRKPSVMVLRLWPVAACLCLAIASATFFLLSRSEQQAGEMAVVKKFTDKAEHKYLLLSDSTQVWLNASSTIDYPEEFGKDKREVYLKGEAFFEVKHAAETPFIIHTGTVTTVVLGTSFNVKAYEGQEHVTVSVKSGKVQVLKQNKLISTLIKGQETKVSKINGRDENDEVNNDLVGAWQQGHLAYEEVRFADIISDMERVYNVDITIRNEQLKQVLVITSFSRDIGVKRALEILCKLTAAKLEEKGGQYFID